MAPMCITMVKITVNSNSFIIGNFTSQVSDILKNIKKGDRVTQPRHFKTKLEEGLLSHVCNFNNARSTFNSRSQHFVHFTMVVHVLVLPQKGREFLT